MMNYIFTKTPLFFFVQAFWRDEAFSYLMAKRNLVEILFLTAKDFNPPLYYFILHFWMKIFGSSEIALRSLSLVFYWATIYIVFLFFNQVFKLNLKKSFVYLTLVIINPTLVYYAFETRMYTLLAFLASLSFYSFYKKHSSIYFISTVLGLYTHYFMILVLLAQLVFVLLTEKSKKFLKLKSIAFPFLLFLPWLVFILINNPVINQSFWIDKPKILYLANLLGSIYVGHEIASNMAKAETLNIIVILLTAVLFFILALPIFVKEKLKKTYRYLILYLAIWGLVIPLFINLVSFVKPIYLPRYLIFSTVGFLLFIIYLLDKLPKKMSIILMIILFLLTLAYQKNQVLSRQKQDLRNVIKEINFLAKKNDRLYVTNELDFMTTQYYFPENRVYIYGKTYQEIPDYIGKVLISPDRITNQLPIYPNKAFILNSNGSYDIKAVY